MAVSAVTTTETYTLTDAKALRAVAISGLSQPHLYAARNVFAGDFWLHRLFDYMHYVQAFGLDCLIYQLF